MTRKELVEALVKKHRTTDIRITWEGGNDDGCYDLFIKGESIDYYRDRESLEYKLIDLISGDMGYYSFAGDFSCSGEARLSDDATAFVGSDSLTENHDFLYSFESPLKINIPKDLWFDSITIHIHGYGEDVAADVRLIISNGPVSEDHIKFEKDTEAYLKREIEEALNNPEVCSDYCEVNNIYMEINQSVSELIKDDKGNYEVLIEDFNYSRYTDEDKDVHIPIL
jgi:hypothetical protein